MGCITVEILNNLMKGRSIDVSVGNIASIFKFTQYQREMFLIQGVVRRGKKCARAVMAHHAQSPCGKQMQATTKNTRIVFLTHNSSRTICRSIY
jgi:hypothetical protein